MSAGFDSDRPDAVPLDELRAKKLPLHAFALLESGDAFDLAQGAPPKDGRARAEAYFAAKVKVHAHGAPSELVKVVREEAVAQLLGNVQLVARLEAARPIEVDLVPAHKRMSAYGYPKGASSRASGLRRSGQTHDAERYRARETGAGRRWTRTGASTRGRFAVRRRELAHRRRRLVLQNLPVRGAATARAAAGPARRAVAATSEAGPCCAASVRRCCGG